MKKVSFFLCIVMISMSLSGCKPFFKGRTEIDDLTFIKVIAFDKGKDGNIKVTASAKNLAMAAGGQAAQPSKAKNITAEGRTVFEAIRNLSLFSEKQPFFGHTEFILVSEKIAKQGLIPTIDFLTRDHELRLNSRIYIVKNIPAQEFLEKSGKGDYYISDRLSRLESNSSKLSETTKVSLTEVMYILDRPYLSLYVPCVEMKKSKQKSEKGKFDIYMKDFGIFKKDKLFRYLNDDESRGVDWLRNLVEGGLIIVKDKKGEDITLEIIYSKTKIEPLIKKNGKLKATITVSLDTVLGEINGYEDVYNKKGRNDLENKQEELVKKEIMNTIKVAKDNKMDFFSLGTHFYQKYPTKWAKYEKEWNQKMSSIEYEVIVDSNIMRSYQLNAPTGRGEK